MLKTISKLLRLKLKRGFATSELIVCLATASLIVGGVTVKGSDLISYAQDIQRAANLKQMVTAMEIYYLDNLNYPIVGGVSSLERSDSMLSQLREYLNTIPTEKENYDYQDFNSGQNYILKVNLKDINSPQLQDDIDGLIQGVDCNDPAYCVKM